MLDQHLVVFLTVAKKRNFSRAGEALRMSQPGVSQYVSALEEYYGAKLFDRTNKRVELTRAGEALLPFAETIVELHNRARQAIADLVGNVSGKIHIGTSYTIGEYILPLILARFTSDYPEVEIRVKIDNTEQVSRELEQYKLDIGLVEGKVTSGGLSVEPFLRDEMSVILPKYHRLASSRTVTLEDLMEETWLLREEGSGTRAVADEMFSCFGRFPSRRIILGSTQAIKESVAAGLGVSLLSTWAVGRDVEHGVLCTASVSGFDSSRMLSIVLPKSEFHTRAVLAFRALALRMVAGA
jgi:DNA-binding transcriptional LysR family regulator